MASEIQPLQSVLVPLATITAAIIAGLFSFLALIISKEHKISEFRQVWVDSLRNQISKFTSGVVTARAKIAAANNGDTVVDATPSNLGIVSEEFSKMSESFSEIMLRLNPEESLSQELIKYLDETRAFIEVGDFEAATSMLKNVRMAARNVLKQEWVRVKNGEKIYVIAKRLSGALIVMGFLALVLLCFSHRIISFFQCG